MASADQEEPSDDGTDANLLVNNNNNNDDIREPAGEESSDPNMDDDGDDSLSSVDSGPIGWIHDRNSDEEEDRISQDPLLLERNHLTTMTVPQTIEEARKRCVCILNSPHWRDKEQQERVQEIFMSILRQHPKLAAERIRNRHFGFRMNAMFHLLLAAAKLPVIQECHALNPKAVKKRYLINVYPIHIACSHCGADVIEYLAKLHPRALLERSIMNGAPLHLILNRRVEDMPLDIIKTLVEQCPESINLTDIHQRNCLEIALGSHADVDVIEYLVSKFPENMTELSIKERREDQWNLTLEKVSAITKLFPRLKKLKFGVKTWETEGLIYFFNTLRHNTSISTITNLLLPTQSLVDIDELNGERRYVRTNEQARICRAIEDWLKYNAALQDITLEVHRDQPPDDETETLTDDNIFQAISRGVCCNFSVGDKNAGKRLKLIDFSLRDCHQLCDFLSKGAVPKELVLSKFAPNGKWPSTAQDSWENCCVKHFEFLDFPSTASVEFIPEFVRDISRMPMLQTLKLDFGARQLRQSAPVADLTRSMVTILTKSPRLESLHVKGATLDAIAVFESLKHNICLIRYEINSTLAFESSRVCLEKVLAKHNSTLRHVVMPQTLLETEACQAWRKIQYYLLLNGLGRREIRDPVVSRERVVECLIEARESVAHSEVLESVSVESFVLQYGILREMPSAWSYSEDSLNQRKRKHAESV